MAGVTQTGFVTKRFPEVLEGLQEKAVAVFQDVVPVGDVVDTSDSTTLGRLIGLTTPAIAEVWEAMQEVYSAFDPKSASGVALDNLVDIGGMSRITGSPTSFSGVVWGDVYTEIPANSTVKSSSTQTQYSSRTDLILTPSNTYGVGVEITDTTIGNVYEITIIHQNQTVTLTTTAIGGDTDLIIFQRLLTQLGVNADIGGVVVGNVLRFYVKQHYSSFNGSVTGDLLLTKIAHRLQFYALEDGTAVPAIGSVDTIVTSVLGWDAVSNPIKATAGKARETDEQLRTRFSESKYLRAQNTIDSLYSEIREIAGVSEYRVYVNSTDLTDAIELTPHSFSVLLVGGDDVEIAQAIWRHTPAGVASKGTTSVSILTAQGEEQVVRFQRPVYVPIYVEVNLTTDSSFPSGGNDQIKSDLVAYIAEAQNIGTKVVYSRLFDAVNKTPGHEIVTLKIGTSPGSLSETTIAMAYNQIATLSASNITII